MAASFCFNKHKTAHNRRTILGGLCLPLVCMFADGYNRKGTAKPKVKL